MASRRKYQPRDPAITSRIMASISPKGGKAERAVRSALHRRGFRFRKQVFGLRGRPDIVFTTEKVAVFIDGDFWHARAVREDGMTAYAQGIRHGNREYWIAKAEDRVRRDDLVTAELGATGWRVLRYWESLAESRLTSVVDDIADVVLNRRRG